MKKTILAVVFFTGIGCLNQAKSQLHLGIKGGANMNKLDGVSYKDKFELGYQLGGFVGYDLSDKIGLQAEVLFNQTNTEVEDGLGSVWGSAFSGDKKLNYVSVPVLLKFFPKSLISVYAGPQFSMLVNKSKSVLENGQELFKSSDFSAVAGLELNLNPLKIYGRYVWGFTDIGEIGGKAKSQQIQFGVGFRIF